MKSRVTQIEGLLLSMAAAMAVLISLSCNTTPTGTGTLDITHSISGAVVIDDNRHSTTVVADFRRSGKFLPNAETMLNGDTLVFNWAGFPLDSVFSQYFATSSPYDVDSQWLVLQDSTIFTDSIMVLLTDTFTITDVVPPDRLVQGNGSVSLQWSGSDSASGYAMAAVLRRNAYKGTGYSTWVTTQETAGTIPPDAFSLSPGPLPDTGWYYLYVYSYTGVPDSALTSFTLPVPLPSQLADDIARTKFTGNFGSVRIAQFDSVRVTFQP